MLYGILPDSQFDHIMLLSQAIFLLYSQNIPLVDLSVARIALDRFCADFANLYGLQFQTTNFHNIRHLVDNVIEVGPLWSFDCFPYENISGWMVKLIHGTQHVEKQIARAISTLHKLPLLIDDLAVKLPHCADFTKTLLADNEIDLDVKKGFYVSEKLSLIGKVKNIKVTNELNELILCFLGHIPATMSVYQFCRFMFKGVLYHSKLYSKVVKRNSFTVQYRNGAGELAYAQIIEGLHVILEESVHPLLIVDK